MPERINGGQALVVVAAIGLIVSLFLDWYTPDVSAWNAFETVDLLLAALAVTALVIAIGGAVYPEGSLTALAPRWLPAVGIAALAIVTAALINHPPTAIHRSTETGAWIALGAAGALTLGAILSAARVSLVITLRPRQGDSEWSDSAPAAANQDETEPYADAADEEYGDEYAETEYVDADGGDADYAEQEPTAEVSMPEDEPARLPEDERG
jgi:hypothetical protein